MILGPLPFLRSFSSPTAETAAQGATVSPSLTRPDGTFRRFQSLTRAEGVSTFLRGDMLLGGVPFLGMEWGAFAGVVIGTGIVTLLIRGVQAVWESKVRPFGSLGDINLLIHNWAVTDEDEARGMAANIGRLFLEHVKERMNAYDNEHFQLPYTVEPNEWRDIDDKRQRITGRYVRDFLKGFHDFGRGLGLLSGRDYGDVYRDFFSDFMDKLFLVVSPLTRWQNPPTAEDIHNFDTFRTVLRREIPVLEAKIRATQAPQAV